MNVRRLLFYWFISFVAIFVANAVAVVAWTMFQYNDFFLLVGLLNAPFISLFFGWFYFRPGFAQALSQRFLSIFSWIAFNILLGMIVFALLDGSEAKDKLSFPSLLLESGNFIALLVAAYLAIKPRQSGSSSPQLHSKKIKDEATDLFTPAG